MNGGFLAMNRLKWRVNKFALQFIRKQYRKKALPEELYISSFRQRA